MVPLTWQATWYQIMWMQLPWNADAMVFNVVAFFASGTYFVPKYLGNLVLIILEMSLNCNYPNWFSKCVIFSYISRV